MTTCPPMIYLLLWIKKGSELGKGLWIEVTVAGLAQSVECLTAEWEVAGSIPGAGPILWVLK